MKTIMDYHFILADHELMPALGMGLYRINEQDVFEDVLKQSLRQGYRHFDTASVYGNENLLGNIIIQELVPRDSLFITTKLSRTEYGYYKAKRAFNESLERLKTDYVNLYLLHWPQNDLMVETWLSLEELYSQGFIKSIGVSNFNIDHLDVLIKHARVLPTVNQIEHHPFFQQKELVSFCETHNIQVIAHSPLLWGNIRDNVLLDYLSEKYDKTKAQIILRWNIQKRIAVIPKSSKISRIAENAAIFDFELCDNDIDQIDDLDMGLRIGGRP